MNIEKKRKCQGIRRLLEYANKRMLADLVAWSTDFLRGICRAGVKRKRKRNMYMLRGLDTFTRSSCLYYIVFSQIQA